MTLKENIKGNWADRSYSEKIVIIIVGGLFLCTLFYLVVAQPLLDWKTQQHRQFKANKKILVQVDELVKRYNKMDHNPQETKGLTGLINQSLREHDLVMKGFQPGKNNDARLSLNDVQYKPLVSWLYDIEHKYRLTVEDFSLVQVKKTGLLSAKIRVRQ